jgi:outer membrane biosynthesis protein TonB
MKKAKVSLLMSLLIASSCAKAPSAPSPLSDPTHAPGPYMMVKPHYPDACPSFRGDAIVNLKFMIEPDGTVTHVQILDETPAGCGFADEMLRVFSKWTFYPFRANGMPIEHDGYYRFTFRDGAKEN